MRRAYILICLKDFNVTIGTRVMKLSGKEFDLYCLLALRRLEDREGGYVEADEIVELPTWAKNTVESVGKQIRRHIQTLDKKGFAPIESRRRVKGPFRLCSDDIAVDVSLEQLAARLNVGGLIGRLSEAELKRFYSFIVQMWRGNKAINDGKLERALKNYNGALALAVLAHHRTLAFYNVVRVLERLGNYAEALSIHQDAVAALTEVKQDRDWADAKLAAIGGWLEWRTGQVSRAARQYANAQIHIGTHRNHQLAGEIYNGLGLVAKERGQLSHALAMYHQSLECTVLAEDYYGIQGAYFNIGLVYSLIGDRSWKVRQQKTARESYLVALEWTTHCISLCEHLAIADDTSDDRILLSHIQQRLGHLTAAFNAAQQANQLAKRAKNQRCIALSYREIADVFIARREPDKVAEAIHECKQKVKPEFLKYLRESDLLSRLAGNISAGSD